MNSPEMVRVLCGLPEPLQAADVAALPPFAPQVMDFLADLSASLLHDAAAIANTDVAAFAFFCRRANLQSMREAYHDLDTRLGRGLTFHIAPGNVPMNFAYSLVSALLAGNACIVKAPSKAFDQVTLTATAMQTLLEGKHQALQPYVNVIAYPREQQDITETFSAYCDARIIWGGDETIRRVRMAALAPRAFDITFADRWSMAVLDADAILRMRDSEVTALAEGFYNDTYLYDQNACTSPRLCVWMGNGDERKAAKARFWDAVHRVAAVRYPLDAVTAVDKETELYRAAMLLDGVQKEQTKDNIVLRIRLRELVPEIMKLHCTGGCFLEYDAQMLEELTPILTSKLQTVGCTGIDPAVIRSFVTAAGARGVDRVVRIGHTMDFSLVWDGYDLIESLSRKLR